MASRWRFESLAPALFFARTSISDAGWSSLVARRAHNPKVAGSNPAPAIAADQGVGLARALQTGRPGPRRPSVRAAFVVSGFVPISYQFFGEAPSRPWDIHAPAQSPSDPRRRARP